MPALSRVRPSKMGCISSKFMSRSISFHGVQNQSLDRTANDIPALDKVIMSDSGIDHSFALVCTANMVINRLQSWDFSSNTCPEPAIEPVNSETINTSKLMASLDQGVVKQAQPAPEPVGSIDVHLTRSGQSKSCHWFLEHEYSSLALEISDGIRGDKSDWSHKCMIHNRSFHTVEENDSMLENISSSAQQRGLDGKDYGSGMKAFPLGSKSSSNISHHAEDKETGLQETKQSFLHGKSLVYENTMFKETGAKEVMPSPNCNSSSSGEENQQVMPSPYSTSSTKESHTVLEIRAQEGNIIEKGFKRKAIAEGLESLRIPPTIEFPTISSLREWIHAGGQVYSPGSYVTPKFGSYSLPIPVNIDECSKDYIFNPELVAALEQCMHQLEEEEESILKQIVENLEKDYNEDKQAEEEKPHRED